MKFILTSFLLISLVFTGMQNSSHAHSMDHQTHEHHLHGAHDADEHHTSQHAEQGQECSKSCNKNCCHHGQSIPESFSPVVSLVGENKQLSLHNQLHTGLVHGPDSPPPNLL